MLTFIGSMKKLFILFSLVMLAACTQAQNKHDITYIPPFKILKADSTSFTPANLKKDKPVMIIYFSPDCTHCQHLVYEMKPKMKEFADVQIVMITFTDFNRLIMLKNFIRDFNMAKYPNITIGTEGRTYVVQQFYQVATTPYIAIYDHKGKLVRAFDKAPTMDELIAEVKKA
jgi:thioredoxin-related protein